MDIDLIGVGLPIPVPTKTEVMEMIKQDSDFYRYVEEGKVDLMLDVMLEEIKSDVIEELKVDPDFYRYLKDDAQRNDPDILDALLEGIKTMSGDRKSFFTGENLRTRMKIPYGFLNSDKFLTTAASVTGFGYADIKATGRMDLVTDELIYSTIETFKDVKRRGEALGLDVLLIFQTIPERLNEDMAFEFICLNPNIVFGLPDRFITDEFFNRLLDANVYQWLNVGDYPDYKYNGKTRSVKEDIFGRLSEDTIRRALSFQHFFYHPEGGGLNEDDYYKLSSKIPHKYQHLIKKGKWVTMSEEVINASKTDEGLLKNTKDFYDRVVGECNGIINSAYKNEPGELIDKLARFGSYWVSKTGGVCDTVKSPNSVTFEIYYWPDKFLTTKVYSIEHNVSITDSLSGDLIAFAEKTTLLYYRTHGGSYDKKINDLISELFQEPQISPFLYSR